MADQKLSVEDRLRWYERLLGLSQRVTAESLESVCRYLMDDAIEAAKAQLGYLFLTDRNGQLAVAYARREGREDIPERDRHFSESILKRAVEMKAPLIVDDATNHPEFRDAKSVIAANLKSVLALPLYFEKDMIGAIYLENRNQAQYFAPELLDFLTLFSTQGAVLLHSKIVASLGAKTKTSSGLLESKSPRMQRVYQEAMAAAKSDTSVLILGETGTGKEVTAKYIHSMSARAKEPFVAINCAAIPETLIESELFGYKKGAFTGAMTDRDGLIKRANKGTLFLDEIGDLALHMQAKLLRVIQEKKFTRLGSTQEEESHFRLICATHRPLENAVSQGLFRQDLYFRINTITLELPPLRERAEDILDLAHLFLEQSAADTKKKIVGFDEGASGLLLHEEWPGNIRQLQNAIQRAAALVSAESGPVRLTAKDFAFLAKTQTPSESLPSLQEAKEEFIKNYVKKAILIHKGNKTKAAKALGVDPKTLYRHLISDRDKDSDADDE